MKKFPQFLIFTILAVFLCINFFNFNTLNLQNLTKPKIAFAQTNERSLRLHNYGQFRSTNDEGWTPTQAKEELSKRDIIVSQEAWYNQIDELNYPKITPAGMKMLNPDVKVYIYYTLLFKHDDEDLRTDKAQGQPLSRATIDANDWWLRDSLGQICKEPNYPENLVIDVGKSGVKEAYLTAILERMANKGYDGTVLDIWEYPGWLSYHTGGNFPPQYPNEDAFFNNAWKPFMTYVTTGLRNAGYQIIGNEAGLYTQTDQIRVFNRSLINGVVYEKGAIGWNGDWLAGSEVIQTINSLGGDPLEVLSTTGGLFNTVTELQRKKLVSQAMYYIGIPVDQSLRSYNYTYNSKIFWDPLWDFNIGTPVENKVQVTGKYAWSRKYTNGLVLLNYGTNPTDTNDPINFTLDKEYIDSSGTTYSGINSVQVHTALILQAKSSANPDIVITKSASDSSVISGATLTYTITVKNQGGQTAKSVVLTDPIDIAKVQFISADRSGTFLNNTVSWPAFDIPTGVTETFTFQVRVLL